MCRVSPVRGKKNNAFRFENAPNLTCEILYFVFLYFQDCLRNMSQYSSGDYEMVQIKYNLIYTLHKIS